MTAVGRASGMKEMANSGAFLTKSGDMTHTHTQICTLYLGKLKIFEEIIYTTIFNFHQHLPYISENEDVVFAHQEPLNIGFTLAVGSFETFHLLVT